MNVNSPNASNHVAYHDKGAVGGPTILKQNCCNGDASLPYGEISIAQRQSDPMMYKKSSFSFVSLLPYVSSLCRSDSDSMEDYDTADVPTARPNLVKKNHFSEVGFLLFV